MNTNSFSFQFNPTNSFQIGKNEKHYADENALISDAPYEVQRLIVDVYKISQKYDQNDRVNVNESFETSLCDIDESMSNMLNHSIVNLTREIDFGQEEIDNYRNNLEEAQIAFFEDNKNQNSKKNNYFDKYCKKIAEKHDYISKSIQILESQINSSASSSFPSSNLKNEKDNYHLITLMCKEQHDAIIRCSARIYRLSERTEEIRNKLLQYTSFTLKTNSNTHDSDKLLSSFNKNETLYSSYTSKYLHDYKEHIEEYKRKLERRITDKSSFKKDAPKQTFGFSFGTGNSLSNGFPKANYGTNNMFSSPSKLNTNATITSNPINSVLSTPTKQAPSTSNRQNSNHFSTPSKAASPMKEAFSGILPTGIGAPRKGTSHNAILPDL